MESLEVTGKTVDEAIEKALAQLGVGRDDVEVVVVDKGRSGILGLGSGEAKVRVDLRSGDLVDLAKATIENILRIMGVKATVGLPETPVRAGAGETGDNLTFNIDGEGGTDSVEINLNGVSDVIFNVFDSGAPDDGLDTLTINGTDGDDSFLSRRNFIALLHGTVETGFDPDLERINYDGSINARVRVNGGLGDDSFYSDDNSAIMTLDGGAGDDSFQIGQMFGTARDAAAGIAPGDEIETIETTVGFLSRGISLPTVIYGGEGNDSFTIYRNTAELRLEGEAGNDTFIIRAFLLAGNNEVLIEGKTILNAGDGDDFIEYN
ncbi:MAG: Jag N-terminal domain-containing protein, partial [Chloroflexi bacterium]|nr:Jag N-terminal domain-containing protein [Chloroflexota bacterium]